MQPKAVAKTTATRDRSTWFRSIPASLIAKEEATKAHADKRSRRLVFRPGTTVAGRKGCTRKARRGPAVVQAVIVLGSRGLCGIRPASGPKGLTEPIPVIVTGGKFGVMSGHSQI